MPDIPAAEALPTAHYAQAAQIYQAPTNFYAGGEPSWMRGGQMDLGAQGYAGMPGGAGKALPNWFQMPQWGHDVQGNPISQAQANAPPPQMAAAPPPPPAAAPLPPAAASARGGWLDQYKAGVLDKQDAYDMLRAQGMNRLEAVRARNQIMRNPNVVMRDRWSGGPLNWKDGG